MKKENKKREEDNKRRKEEINPFEGWRESKSDSLNEEKAAP